jgi:AcrR family transcriptional regulator
MPAHSTHGEKATGFAKSRKGEISRARILNLARRILIDDGYDAFIMRDIATQANMKLGNLQYYFPTRESLLEAVLLEEANADLDELKAIHQTHNDIVAEFTALVKFLVKKWRGESGKVVAIMGFLALHRPSFRRIYNEIYERFYRQLEAVIRRVDPGHKPQTYRRRAQLITALIDGAAMQVQRGSSPAFLEDVANHALRIARDGK